MDDPAGIAPDCDPARIASVLQLACKISRSWDLGRPLSQRTIESPTLPAYLPFNDIEDKGCADSEDDSFSEDPIVLPIKRGTSSSSKSKVIKKYSKRQLFKSCKSWRPLGGSDPMN